MNPFVHFCWYRRWRGGVWGHHSSWCFPWKTWSRFDYMPADFSARLGDEDWRKPHKDVLGRRNLGARMDRVKLLQNPLPIDRVAARVARKARPEDLWRPMPKAAEHLVAPGTVLATAPLAWAAINSNPALKSVPGSRRGRMVILGYAADQGAERNTTARWVARCDCGNHEYRTRILRWLGTEAPDMCRECRTRIYKMRGEFCPRDPAKRATAP